MALIKDPFTGVDFSDARVLGEFEGCITAVSELPIMEATGCAMIYLQDNRKVIMFGRKFLLTLSQEEAHACMWHEIGHLKEAHAITSWDSIIGKTEFIADAYAVKGSGVDNTLRMLDKVEQYATPIVPWFIRPLFKFQMAVRKRVVKRFSISGLS